MKFSLYPSKLSETELNIFIKYKILYIYYIHTFHKVIVLVRYYAWITNCKYNYYLLLVCKLGIKSHSLYIPQYILCAHASGTQKVWCKSKKPPNCSLTVQGFKIKTTQPYCFAANWSCTTATKYHLGQGDSAFFSIRRVTGQTSGL